MAGRRGSRLGEVMAWVVAVATVAIASSMGSGSVRATVVVGAGALVMLGGSVRQSLRRRSDIELRYLLHIKELCFPFGTVGATGSETRGSEHPSSDEPFASIDVTEAGRQERRPITSYLGRPKPVVLTLLGGPGTGKTSLLKQLAAQRVGGELTSSRDQPVLLRLRDCELSIVADPQTTLVDVVRASLGDSEGRAWSRWFERRLRRGRCLVLLDALDDVAPIQQPRVSVWLTEQVKRYPRNDFLVTSRNLTTPWLPTLDGSVLTLQPFTDKQIAEYLLRRLPHADQVALRARPDVLDLARTPFLLGALMRVYGMTRQLPSSPAVLYGELLKHLLEMAGPIEGDTAGLSSAGKLRVVRVLALYMTEQGRDRAPEVECARAIQPALRRSGSLRPAEFLQRMVNDGVLVQREKDEFAFAYRAFQDYLAAEQIRAQGSVRLLVEHMAEPQWRDIILTWAASADASPFIEACLRRGTDDMLQLALDCAEVSPQIEPELRSQLSRRRPRRGAELSTDALTAFVEKSHSAPATALLRRARHEDRPVNRDDIDGLLARTQSRPAHEWTEADASALLSAAVLATERADHSEAGAYRFQGLIALGYAMRGQSLASSRDLALAALRHLDPDGLPVTAVRMVCLAYLGSVADPGEHESFVRAVRTACREAGAKACALLVPLVAAHRESARLVVEAVGGDAELAHRMADALGTDPVGATNITGWDAAVDKWHRTRRELVHQFCDLAHLVLEPKPLLHARELVADRLKERLPVMPELEVLARALDYLDDFLRYPEFDKRDAALRAAARQAGFVRAAVRAAPTDLSVELSEPAAAWIEKLVGDERSRLAQRYPPQPRIGAALPVARVVGRTVTVPVEVANEDERSAPVEGASLTATGDLALLVPGNEWTAVSAPVPGGAATTVLLRLDLTEAAQDAAEIEVQVALQHRLRDSEEPGVRRACLTFAVDRTHMAINPNPYTAGNTGIPVNDPNMLFGRDELIDKVRTTLRAASTPGAGIAIFGQKRTGKSSIGVELMRRLTAIDGLPVVDVGNLGGLTPQRESGTDQATLLGTLLWRIIEGADTTIQAGPRLIPDGFDRKAMIESPDPVADCTRLFRNYRSARPDSPPWVVFIDEFQYMDQWIREKRVPPSFMQTFKAIVERRLFHLVLVGQAHLERLIEEDPNAFSVFGLERVTCLAEPDARALIQQPVLLDTPQGPVSRHHDRAVSEILRLTGGNPYYIQKICYGLVQHMNKEHATMATDADVRQVTRQLLDTLKRGQFDALESPDAGDTRWTQAELSAAVIAVARACQDGPASREKIRRCHEGDLAPQLLEHLVSREVVRQIGDRYEFVVGLFEEWLRRYFAALEGRP
ncbi:NACHT domain-containing protein [Streptomyces sp. S.PB5]|uniref:NACHT domain-containing protein n=1 Tax=Streptomyces sp. S.PB5 TaxID=3020844 RepID=UPI0025B26903|nr:NACHT domain-containing protein [Streptomyces sp. S.PB5]MDN3029692.1 NACHT domain-containing protein [Streptomyces sp. S.PB5]